MTAEQHPLKSSALIESYSSYLELTTKDKNQYDTDVLNFLSYVEFRGIGTLKRINTQTIKDYIHSLRYSKEYKNDERGLQIVIQSIIKYLTFLESTYELYIDLRLIKKIMDKKINRIKEVLVIQGMPQKELANLLGRNPNTITSMCNNRSQPHLKDLKRIAEILNVNIKDLIV